MASDRDHATAPAPQPPARAPARVAAGITLTSPTTIASLVGGVTTLLRLFGYELPISDADLSNGILAVIPLGSFGYVLYRRWRQARRNAS